MTPDEAYANSAYIPDGDTYLGRWAASAKAFRGNWPAKDLGVAYGGGDRQTYDMFWPEGDPKGTLVFVHGGYWMALSPRDFSHLASGALANGLACAMPSYTLAPQARITDMTREIASAITAIAARTQGPIYLAGHSAGGHLVARMTTAGSMMPWLGRLARVMPISPISDLAPLRETSMNDTLKIDAQEARDESPISHGGADRPATVWVGAQERPAFLDQAKRLADHWACDLVIEPDRHHFDVIEGLEDPDSAMMQALLK